MKDARTLIAKEMGVEADQYGLFIPPKEEQVGKWCRDDYPLSFYGLEGEKESKEAQLMSNSTVVCIVIPIVIIIVVYLFSLHFLYLFQCMNCCFLKGVFGV